MSRFIIVDGNAILHRAYHALPPLKTKKGEPINAVYGMISMSLKIIEEFKPTHFTFAFDTKEPTFRNKLSVEYQAQRAEVDSDLVSQFARARETLTAFNFCYFEKSGFEADDVIGTIVTIVSKMDAFSEIIVATGDRDLLQLVSDKVSLFMPSVGVASGKKFGREETKEKMGVYPEHIVDYKALVGDPSDNYKGVPGIGPKTAISLIHEFGSLDTMLSHIESLPKKVQEKLTLHRESALLSQKLATIVRDVPLPEFKIDDCNKWHLDNPQGVALFEEFGFKTLTARVKQAAKSILSENQLRLL